ncbi:MAG: primosomal protein N' [Candidatus Krumholzibacteriia bacterium]
MSRLLEVAVPLPLQESFTYVVPEALAENLGLGARVKVPFGRRSIVGYAVGFPQTTSVAELKEIEAVLDDPPILTSRLLDLGRWIAGYYACSFGEALRALLPTGATRKRGAPRGRQAELGRGAALLETAPPSHLNEWQRQVLDRVTERLDAGGYEGFLLHGVTGSGKTEVYLYAVRHALERRRAAILLIPEIALTPQAADRFRSRLGAEVGILHSGMTLAERHDVLSAAARGELQVVLGARSAVFAPFRNLGLIVVDEEQESSYKQSEKPRYHARAVALVRGSLEGAAVLLGSATPSLESYHNTMRAKHALLRIPERVDGRPLPRVHVVDMRAEENRRAVLSGALLDALAERLERREQSILLLNRRGHSNYVQCFACGELVRCPYCDISLTYHAVGQVLRCHYCNHARPVPEECPSCSNPCQVFRGLGTQRLEQELAGLLPRARLRRMDFDTTSRRGAHRAILEEFARGEADVLLGTQMVAKGHDFPHVTLVGVVQADAGLSLPDFRAAERTFHLLAQVAGRAGRGERPGDVFIQTLCPDHYTIALAAAQDYGAFFERESKLRRSLGYPPFARLLGITGLGPDRDRLARTMEAVARELRNAGLGAAVQVLGPANSAIPRLRGRFRAQILVKGSLAPQAKEGLLGVLERRGRRAPGVEFQVDVDPVNML